MASPSAFFSVLATFAADLEAAHADNDAADAAVEAATTRPGGIVVGRAASRSPTPSASGTSSRQDALQRVKQMSLQRRHGAVARPTLPDPEPAVATASTELQRNSLLNQPPVALAASDTTTPMLVAPSAPAARAGKESEGRARASLSTPVVELLNESLRLIRSAEEAAWLDEQQHAMRQSAQLPAQGAASPAAAGQQLEQALDSPFGEPHSSAAGRYDKDSPEEEAAGAAVAEPAATPASRPMPLPETEQSLSHLAGAQSLRQRLMLSPASTPLSRMSSSRQLSERLSGSAGSTPASGRLLAMTPQQSASPQTEQKQRPGLSTLGQADGPNASGFAELRAVATSFDAIAAVELVQAAAPVPAVEYSPRQQLLQEQRVEAALAVALASHRTSGELGRLSLGDGGGILERGSLDDLSLRTSQQQRGAALRGSKRVSFSLPASPGGGRDSRVAGAGALDLRRVANRLQSFAEVVAEATPKSQAADEGAAAQAGAGVSPPFAALLSSIPTPPPGALAALASGWAAGSSATATAALPVEPEPSPIGYSTRDMDRAVAALVRSVGNSPTGPLARGVRDGEGVFGDIEAAAARQAPAGDNPTAAVHLLEPLMPAPLGEGVR